jgi:hypothetical protein
MLNKITYFLCTNQYCNISGAHSKTQLDCIPSKGISSVKFIEMLNKITYFLRHINAATLVEFKILNKITYFLRHINAMTLVKFIQMLDEIMYHLRAHNISSSFKCLMRSHTA